MGPTNSFDVTKYHEILITKSKVAIIIISEWDPVILIKDWIFEKNDDGKYHNKLATKNYLKTIADALESVKSKEDLIQ